MAAALAVAALAALEVAAALKVAAAGWIAASKARLSLPHARCLASVAAAMACVAAVALGVTAAAGWTAVSKARLSPPHARCPASVAAALACVAAAALLTSRRGMNSWRWVRTATGRSRLVRPPHARWSARPVAPEVWCRCGQRLWWLRSTSMAAWRRLWLRSTTAPVVVWEEAVVEA